MFSQLEDVGTGILLLLLLLVSDEIGFRAGLWSKARNDKDAGTQIGAVQGAVLGLLGLLLAFSFSAAGARFLERQDLIVQEANAIGTAYLRADLLDDEPAALLRGSLHRYTDHRIETSGHLRQGLPPEAAAQIEKLHNGIWTAARDGVKARPEAALSVLPPVNEVIDLHTLRIAAGKKHIPGLVLGLLVACSALAIGTIGYGCGLGGNRRVPLTWSLALLVTGSLWVTIDLDHPRGGLLQISDAPLSQITFGGVER